VPAPYCLASRGWMNRGGEDEEEEAWMKRGEQEEEEVW
jgi:hypothetical protein